MFSSWGDSWGQSFNEAWGLLDDVVAPIIPDNIKWGYGGVITPIKKLKTKQQLQNEQLLMVL